MRIEYKFGRFFLDDHFLTFEEVFNYIKFLEQENEDLKNKYEDLNNGKTKRAYTAYSSSRPSDHILSRRTASNNTDTES